MFNKVIMVGNLTRNVELRYLNTGSALASFGLASNRRYKRADGMQVDDTCFVDVTLFGRTAEVANQYLKKGSKVLIEGRLNFEQWQDQQGNKRSRHTIVAESMQMLDSKPQSDYGYAGNNQMDSYDSPYQKNQTQDSYNSQQYNNIDMNNNNSIRTNNSSGFGNANNQNGHNEPPVIDIDEEIPF